MAFVEEGARKRYPNGMSPKIRRALDHELGGHGRAQLRALFSDRARHRANFRSRKGILCQGRGSAANSVICFCLGITEVDPEQVDLLFERFVSAERREPPDIDVDFEHERREDVIQYIYETLFPRALRHRGDRDLLSRPQRHSRGRQGFRALGRHRRGARRRRSGAGRWKASSQKEARRAGLDPSDPAHCAGARADPGADGLPAPSVAARRRLRHHPRPARRSGADRECRHGGPHLRRVGQGRSQRSQYSEGRCARRSACSRACGAASICCARITASNATSSPSRTKTPPSTA